LAILRDDPTHLQALIELGNLALAGGFRQAARTAYLQAVEHHPDNCMARVNLANVLRADSDVEGARLHYEAALAIGDMPEAHQGMAWVLKDNDPEAAEVHWRRGFLGRSLLQKPYRGTGRGIPLLLLVSARGGNLPTDLWITDRRFTIHALYAEFYDPEMSLPDHALIVNAIGDADLCQTALARSEEVLRRTRAPVINHPARVRTTGRVNIARRLAVIPAVIAPRIEAMHPRAIPAADLSFPLLLRRPGFHTGEHFRQVANRGDLTDAIDSLTGTGGAAIDAPMAQELLVISYLDARGADGMARKYRVMFIDGVAYPLHLAISRDWKVHYFSSQMADNAAFREEERRFLADMPGVLGAKAMRALAQIAAELDLDYAGIDFALRADGSVMLFEANATMVVFPPGPDPKWDYRRPAIDAVLAAATRMLIARVGQTAVIDESGACGG
jgi:hypothetical protein